jgi:hypothetical protein
MLVVNFCWLLFVAVAHRSLEKKFLMISKVGFYSDVITPTTFLSKVR